MKNVIEGRFNTTHVTGEDFTEDNNRALRDQYVTRTEVLNKVKGLAMLPDDIHITVEMAANYYGVPKQAIKSLIHDHGQEVLSDGLKILEGPKLKEFKARFLKGTNLENAYKFAPSLTLLPRRAILRVGMLLRDSEVAKTVRSYLLNVEERAKAKDPDTMKEAIELLFRFGEVVPKLLEQNKQLEAEIKVLAPKAERFDQFLNSEGLMYIGDMAKAFKIPGMGPRKMFDYLRGRNILYKSEDRNVPIQRYVDAGYFMVKYETIRVYNKFLCRHIEKVIPTTYIKPAGINFVYGLLVKDGYMNEGHSA
jgi:phage antirepressor YoqD-like protein